MKNHNCYPWIIAGTYLLFSTCWIIFSDLLLESYISGLVSYAHGQTIKGLFFISLSTVIILLVSRQLMRKKNYAEGRFRKAKSAFISLFKNAPIGYSIVDANGYIRESNSFFRGILGITPDRRHDNIRVFFQQEDGEQIISWMHSPVVKDRPESQMLQRRMKTADGRMIWALINISHISQGGQYLVSVQDISSEKEIMNELFALKSELREIGKAGNIGHWELDIETGSIKLSEEIQFMLKPTAGKSQSSKEEFISLLSEKEARHVRNAVQESRISNFPLDVTFEYESADHVLRYFHLSGNWQASKKTHQIILAGTIRDISIDVKLLQKQTEYARHLDNWTGTVSHQLRGPITTMGGLLNLLVRKEITDQEVNLIIHHMRNSYTEMDELTRRFGTELVTQKKSIES